jgi:hypothetical protein
MKHTKKGFVGKVGKVTLESAAGRSSTCSEGKLAGKVTGLKTDEVTVTLTGCKVGVDNCKTTGAKEGEVTLPLTGTLVYVNKATHLMAWLYDLPSAGRLIDCFVICLKFTRSLEGSLEQEFEEEAEFKG